MGRSWALENADLVAADLRVWLEPVCARIEVVGSVRRRRPRVGDVDLLAVERRSGGLLDRLIQLSFDELVHIRPRDGATLRIVHVHSGIPVDVHLATLDAWAHALVMRTGGKEFLSRLREAAVARRFLLHDDGRIEVKAGKFQRVKDERHFFMALKVPWTAPEDRA
jgi:DNA polymerase/3'-5' exonuclease PolX